MYAQIKILEGKWIRDCNVFTCPFNDLGSIINDYFDDNDEAKLHIKIVPLTLEQFQKICGEN